MCGVEEREVGAALEESKESESTAFSMSSHSFVKLSNTLVIVKDVANSANWLKVQSQKTNSNLDLDRIEREREFITKNGNANMGQITAKNQRVFNPSNACSIFHTTLTCIDLMVHQTALCPDNILSATTC
jgi:hypothetical protein